MLHAFNFRLSNTFCGFLMMPHAPFHNFVLGDFLPPFAMCRVFPCSDYYGGSVAMLDIQRLSA